MPDRTAPGTVEGASMLNRGGGAPSAGGWAESHYDTSETDIQEDEMLGIDGEWDSDEGGSEGEGPGEEAKGGEEEGPSSRRAPAEVPAPVKAGDLSREVETHGAWAQGLATWLQPESAPPTTARRPRDEEGHGLAGTP